MLPNIIAVLQSSILHYQAQLCLIDHQSGLLNRVLYYIVPVCSTEYDFVLQVPVCTTGYDFVLQGTSL